MVAADRQTLKERKIVTLRKMFICSDQLNSPYSNNAHIFGLSFLFSILFALANSCFFLCAVHAGENANELTLPEQGDKIFDSSDYNVFSVD